MHYPFSKECPLQLGKYMKSAIKRNMCSLRARSQWSQCRGGRVRVRVVHIIRDVLTGNHKGRLELVRTRQTQT